MRKYSLVRCGIFFSLRASLKRIGVILSLLAAVVLTDIHWAVMQSVAWADMIRQDQAVGAESLVDSVVRNVVSADPCKHCDAIQAGQNSEREQQLDILLKLGTLAPITFTQTSLPPREESPFIFVKEPVAQFPDAPSPGIDQPPRV